MFNNNQYPSKMRNKLNVIRPYPATTSVSITLLSFIILILANPIQSVGQSWNTAGNTIGGTEFIGTLNSKPFRMVTKGKTRIKITLGGRVAIGGHAPEQKLDVAGAIKLSSTTDNVTGTMRWTGTDFEGYDGSVWNSFTTVTEADPEVGANTLDYIAKWDGSSLVTSNIYSSGSFVGIGTATPVTGYDFAVNGKIICEEVKVQVSGSWPDYVFDSNYKLMNLTDVSSYIKQHKHLPGTPDANTIKNEGISMGEMSKVMMEKIEELTLHMIEQSKKIEALEKKNTALQEQLNEL
jgi:hypothetical protein